MYDALRQMCNFDHSQPRKCVIERERERELKGNKNINWLGP